MVLKNIFIEKRNVFRLLVKKLHIVITKMYEHHLILVDSRYRTQVYPLLINIYFSKWP